MFWSKLSGNDPFIFTPPQAKKLADAGWTKEMMRTFISQNATTRAYRHPSFHNATLGFGMKEILSLEAGCEARSVDPAALKTALEKQGVYMGGK